MADHLLHLELTSEPTVLEGHYVGDCESKLYMQTRLLDGDTGNLMSEPTTPQPDSSAVATVLSFEFDASIHTFAGFSMT